MSESARLAALLQRGDRVFVGGATNEPRGLIDLLSDAAIPADLTFVHFPIGALNETDFTALSPDARIETFFMTPALARAAHPERVDFLPMHMRWVNDYVARVTDVALLQIGRDRDGVLRVGPNADFFEAALSGARAVVAELNHGFVAPAGAPRVVAERFDLIIETDRPLPEMPPPRIDDTAARIGRNVAELIRDGDCIQTGIGAIPAAILANLTDKNDLGMHGGLIDDAGLELIRGGQMSGGRKEMDAGLHVAGIVMGSRALFEGVAARPDVVLRGADHTHDARAIARLSNFVSINSAVEIDLQGQVNAEVANGRQISGTGGSVDFMRAARMSRGGRSIVAMNATARGGIVSRIVPRVEAVTALRTDVDIVVTEFGVAQLTGLGLEQRAAALRAVAAPEFRDRLDAN